MKLVKLFNTDEMPEETRNELVDAAEMRSSDAVYPWQVGSGSEAYMKRMKKEYPDVENDPQISGYWDLYESCNHVVDDWLLTQDIKSKEVVFFVWGNSFWEKL